MGSHRISGGLLNSRINYGELIGENTDEKYLHNSPYIHTDAFRLGGRPYFSDEK